MFYYTWLVVPVYQNINPAARQSYGCLFMRWCANTTNKRMPAKRDGGASAANNYGAISCSQKTLLTTTGRTAK
jgi:hypothetical protein